MRYVYYGLFYLIQPLLLLRLLWRSRRLPAYRQDLAQRLGWLSVPAQARGGVWLHAVSQGESNAAIPLIRALRQRYPLVPIVVTNTTPTGAACINQALSGQVLQYFMPYDTPGNARRFLSRVQPRLAIVMETELWPAHIAACYARQIPLLLANARLSARSARGYQRFAGLTRHMLRQVSLVAAHAQADAQRFEALGAPKVTVTGNIKFDIPLPEDIVSVAQSLQAQWGVRPVWIAASTHEGEEALMLQVQQQVLSQYPEAVLILVPRHPDRFDEVAQLVAASGLRWARRSKGPVDASVQVYLGDSMGELVALMAAAQACVMGGSFAKVGGHNVLEPAAVGVPVMCGPHMFNFAQIYQWLDEAKAIWSVSESADEIADALCRLLAQELEWQQLRQAALRVVTENQGALPRLLGQITRLAPW